MSRGASMPTFPASPSAMTRTTAFSPDGQPAGVQGAHRRHAPSPGRRTSTCSRSAADASAAPVNLTASNPAWDAQPRFLANGDAGLARAGAPRLRGRPLPRRGARCPRRRGARAHRRLGPLGGAPERHAAMAAPCSSPRTRPASGRCLRSMRAPASRASSSATGRSRTSAVSARQRHLHARRSRRTGRSVPRAARGRARHGD